MKKINEFLENKNEFDRLDTKLYFETAHLSNINDIKVTNYLNYEKMDRK